MTYKIVDQALDQYLLQYECPAIGTELDDVAAMDYAFFLAFKGLGKTWPNPMVGAVFTDADGCLIGSGAHLRCGEAHAEINALKNVSENGLNHKLSGGTLYVTLEPCCHHGKTPPCLEAILQLPIKKIVFAYLDQSEKVKGQSIRALTAKGYVCEQRLPSTPYHSWLTRVFLHQNTTERPWVALKAAMSLDGSVARKGDQRKFITGDRAREYGHFLRAYYGAIAVGCNTFFLDKPRLNARHPLFGEREITKIIWDPMGEGLIRSAEVKPILDTWGTGFPPAIWVCDATYLKENSAHAQILRDLGFSVLGQEELIQFTAKPGGSKNSFAKTSLNVHALDQLLQNLALKFGVSGLLLEGGPGLWTPFLDAARVNVGHFFVAPQLMLGGERLNIIKAELSGEKKNISMQSHTLTLLRDDILLEGLF